MLVIVLLLVLAAGGVLVGAVTANHPEWAWSAVLLCAVGAALLVVERVRRRREASSAAAESSATGEKQSARSAPEQHVAAGSPEASAMNDSPGRHSIERTGQLPVDPAEDPGQEATDGADSSVVSAMDAEIVVVDEFPRYHLAACTWLTDRQVIPLQLREALELGFTPCARCAPDATLVGGERAAR